MTRNKLNAQARQTVTRYWPDPITDEILDRFSIENDEEEEFYIFFDMEFRGEPATVLVGSKSGIQSDETELLYQSAITAHYLETAPQKVEKVYKRILEKTQKTLAQGNVKILKHELYSAGKNMFNRFKLTIVVHSLELNNSGKEINEHWTIGNQYDETANMKKMLRYQAGAAVARDKGMLFDGPTRYAMRNMKSDEKDAFVRCLFENPSPDNEDTSRPSNTTWEHGILLKWKVPVPDGLERVRVGAGRVYARIRLAKGVSWYDHELKCTERDIPLTIVESLVGQPMRSVIEHPAINPDAIIVSASVDGKKTLRVTVDPDLQHIATPQ